jgi:DNA-binding MarR family transcriptional regulator
MAISPYARAMPARQLATAALAKRVWRAMFDVLIRSAPQRSKILARRGLTPNDSRALFSLDTHEGRTMRSLADEWECDPSNATWIVDHLERLGLAERRSVAHDRRVKLVVLTSTGRNARAELLDEFHQPPSEVAALDRADLEALDRVLSKLEPGVPAAMDGAPRGRRRPRKTPSRRDGA